MMALFDQQKAVEQFGYEKKLEGKREAALNMKAEGLADGMIAKFLGVGLDMVQQWLSGVASVKPQNTKNSNARCRTKQAS